jgi:hypothetical protein
LFYKTIQMEDKIRKNLPIEILKYAKEKVEFMEKQLIEDLNLDNAEKGLYSSHLRHDQSLIKSIRFDGPELIWTISTEGLFKLLEYEELEEARKYSKTATNLAIIAIFISIALTIISIYFNYRPITINNEQFQKIYELLPRSL